MKSRDDQEDLDTAESNDLKTNVALIKSELRRFRDWRRVCEDPEYGWNARIRALEDFRLAAQTSHKNMVRWLSIGAGAFSILVDIIDRLFFNKT